MPTQTPEQKAAAYKAAGLSLPISADTLSSPATLNIPTYNPPPPVTIAAPAPIDFGVATKTAAVDQSQTDLKTALDTQGTQAAVRTQLETAQGVPDINKQLNELYAKDAGYQADLTNIASDTLKANNVSTDRLAPTFAIGGEQAQIARQAQNAQQNVNIQRATNAALITAAQGRLSMANDYIQKALDAQFTPLASQIDYLKTVLSTNQDRLSTAEQKQLQQQITDKTNVYNEAKDAKTKIYNTMISAAQSGADNITLQKIQNAATPEAAAAIAAPTLGQAYKDQQTQQQFDNNIKLATLAIDQAKFRNDTKAAAATADPSQILAYAQQYASDGKIPTGLPKGTFGIVSQVAKELPKPDGTLVSVSTGTAPGNLSSAQVDGIVALRDLQNKLDTAKTFYESYNHGILAGIKNAVIPSQQEQQYQNIRGEIVDLLARARSGAALSANEEATYMAKLPSNFNKSFFLGASGTQKIENLKSSLTGKLDTTLATHNVSIYGYSQVKIGNQNYTVGSTVTNAQGQQGRVNADGSITLIQ